jgi:signal transduction histidine kinase
MDARLEAKLRPGTDYHPLQVIPFFRRWRPSTLRSIVLTAIMCGMIVALIAIAISAFGGRLTWRRIHEATIFTVAIAYSQHFLYTLVIRVARRNSSLAPWLMHPLALGLALPMVGIYVGYVIARWVLTGDLRWFNISEGWRELVSRRERAELEANVAHSDKERATAELKALRAQVEPHFLYNTLSNVVSLIDRDPATAKHMTERLIGYLRHTLDASRRDNATVGDELAIVNDYLELLRLRMGDRLAFAINASDEARALPLSPMLLQPLVENAIKHGLEPKIEGGRITVSAAIFDGLLQIRVEDTGLGFGVSTETAGSGSGLTNVRARLKALYGDGAKFVIDQPLEGTRICISLPITVER